MNNQSCDHIAYCEKREGVEVDWTHEWSLNNWVQRYDLECVAPYRIAMLGTMFSLGSPLVGIFVTRLGDIYGRKFPTLISSLIAVPLLSLVLNSTNL